MRRPLFFGSLLFASVAAAAEGPDFVRDVQPILVKHCVSCHGPTKKSSGLRVDTAAAVVKGGNRGAAVVPGKADASVLIHAVTGTRDTAVMPPKGPPLTEQQIAVLKAWIAGGAKGPGDSGGADHKTRSDHWSFQPIARPAVPAVKNAGWVRNPIDAFILARLEKDGLTPSPAADRATLIRRLSLDLLGLPPSPAEVDDFLRDTRPDAYERLIDRLLASPHYGERWGRHWLDAARYADSNGYTIDSARSIWKYRDWVIAALNRDMPFSRFTIEQLAGDLLPAATVDQKIATGFHRNTMINEEGGTDREQFRVESVVDRVNTTGTVWLGLTVGCAQCHDHKYDPVSQRDYYRLFAFFNSADEPRLELATADDLKRRDELIRPVHEEFLRLRTEWERNLTSENRARLPQIVQEALDIPEAKRTPEQKDAVGNAYRSTEVGEAVEKDRDAKLKKIEKDRRITTTLVMQERKAPRTTNVMIRGDFLRKGVAVAPGVPEVLPQPARSANRLDLAQWLVDAGNPLTPRVTVNRIWQQYFGVGLVETENDFGLQGTPPSHPELLDWLSLELIARKWSLKEFHRLIANSATYRQASRHRSDLAEADPRNRLLGRQNRVRVEAEVVRDAALAVSGLLSRTVGGPPVFPPQPAGVDAFTQARKNWLASVGPDRFRRALYTHFWRSAPFPALTVFDAPEGNATCTRRNRSNTPLQALTLANDAAFVELAQGLGARIIKEGGADDAARARYAFRLCLSREATADEAKRLEELAGAMRTDFAKDASGATAVAGTMMPRGGDVALHAAWTTAARALMNLDEFITRE
jgi:cytochrome c553